MYSGKRVLLLVAKFEVITAMKTEATAFWDVTPSCLIDSGEIPTRYAAPEMEFFYLTNQPN
jgi:hypothetical protein